MKTCHKAMSLEKYLNQGSARFRVVYNVHKFASLSRSMREVFFADTQKWMPPAVSLNTEEKRTGHKAM
jgi:hypothetical protein